MMKSVYVCVILLSSTKFTISRGFNLFPILGKIQDGGQDGDHCLWPHRPPAGPPPIKYTSSCWDYQRLPLKAKSFRNTATYQKIWEGVQSTPPSCTTVGVWICVYVQGLRAFLILLHPNLCLQDFRDIFSPCVPPVFSLAMQTAQSIAVYKFSSVQISETDFGVTARAFLRYTPITVATQLGGYVAT